MAEETWQDRVWAKRHEVAEQVTRDFLRPALAAAGVDDVDKYEVSWVREDGFRPGLLAQDGVEYGRCPPSSCPPWPKAEEE
jgi:hypothetical protein